MSKKLDLENLKIIDASAVPAKAIRYTPYREMLMRIRRGKALVLTEEEININTARAGIKRLQKRGEFKQIQMRQGTDTDGKKKLYIINPPRETKTQ